MPHLPHLLLYKQRGPGLPRTARALHLKPRIISPRHYRRTIVWHVIGSSQTVEQRGKWPQREVVRNKGLGTRWWVIDFAPQHQRSIRFTDLGKETTKAIERDLLLWRLSSCHGTFHLRQTYSTFLFGRKQKIWLGTHLDGTEKVWQQRKKKRKFKLFFFIDNWRLLSTS